MQAVKPAGRAEVIGSLLRPRVLKDTIALHLRGAASRGEAERVLAREVARVIARQEAIGFKVVTDGEVGRSSWFGFFFEGMQGFRLAPAHFQFKDASDQAFSWQTCVAAAPIVPRGPMALPEYERARRYAREALVKITMPAPSAFHFFCLEEAVDPAAYPDRARFFADLVKVYCTELKELAAAGCRYVQFDEVPLAMLCDPSVRQQAADRGADPYALLDTYIGLLRQICATRPSGMRLGLHLCRGNFRGRCMAAGGYEPVAEKVFNGVPADVFLLEYDGERAISRHCAWCRRVKSSCSVSYPPNSSVWKTLMTSCAASRRQGASCPSSGSRCRPSAALPASRAAMPSARPGNGPSSS